MARMEFRSISLNLLFISFLLVIHQPGIKIVSGYEPEIDDTEIDISQKQSGDAGVVPDTGAIEPTPTDEIPKTSENIPSSDTPAGNVQKSPEVRSDAGDIKILDGKVQDRVPQGDGEIQDGKPSADGKNPSGVPSSDVPTQVPSGDQGTVTKASEAASDEVKVGESFKSGVSSSQNAGSPAMSSDSKASDDSSTAAQQKSSQPDGSRAVPGSGEADKQPVRDSTTREGQHGVEFGSSPTNSVPVDGKPVLKTDGRGLNPSDSRQDDGLSHMATDSTVDQLLSTVDQVMAPVDKMIESLIVSMPPTAQQMFLKAPFSMSPPRAFIVFVFSIISLLVVSKATVGQLISGSRSKNDKQKVLEQVSNLQNTMLILEQDNEDLSNKLEQAKAELTALRERSVTSSDETADISTKLDTIANERDSLKSTVESQTEKLSSLQSTLSSQSDSLKEREKTVELLEKKVKDTSDHTSLLENQLFELNTTLHESQSSALKMQSQLQSMTEEISLLQTSKDQLLLEAEGWNERVQELTHQISKLTDQQKSGQDAIKFRDREIEVLRDCFRQLKSFEAELDEAEAEEEDDANSDDADDEDDNENGDDDSRSKRIKERVQERIRSMIDVAEISAKLKAIEEERNSLKMAVSSEVESRMELEDKVKQLKADIEGLSNSRQEAEQQASAAAIKMDVLANYFKEKERDLNKKINAQEAREKANANQLANTDEKTKEYEKLVSLYKEQVEDLQKEIQRIDADFRRQIATQEKKAHEHWLTSRQSERECKEAKNEAQALRQRITDLQTRLESATAERKSPLDLIRPGSQIGGMLNGATSPLMAGERPGSRPLPFGEPFMVRPRYGPPGFLPSDRPLPPPPFMRPPMPPPPPMMFDRRHPDMRSPHMFDMPPPHLRRRDDSLSPRDRSPSPPPHPHPSGGGRRDGPPPQFSSSGGGARRDGPPPHSSSSGGRRLPPRGAVMERNDPWSYPQRQPAYPPPPPSSSSSSHQFQRSSSPM